MNQILYKCIDDDIILKNSKKKFIIILIVSISLIFIAVSFYFFTKYQLLQNEKISKSLVSKYNIMTLYSNTSDKYSSELITTQSSSEPFVIGLIQIDEINLIYPILSTVNEELLKISPCRFAGPMPNEVGNLCIAGHNYVDNKQFSKLHLLDIDNKVKVFDLSGNCIEYVIYNKTEISSDDLSCTKQDTNGLKEITLITCNNISGNRVCLKAMEISKGTS